MQFRSGPRGFLRVINPQLISFADFRGNLHYLSVGNINATGRIALILVDQANPRRLKIWGRARVLDRLGNSAEIAALAVPNYVARVERAIMIDVEAFDWHCPQHITRRFTEVEVGQMILPLKEERDSLKARVARSLSPRPANVLGAGPLKLQVTGVWMLTPSVQAYEIRRTRGKPLPEVSPGARLPLPVCDRDGTLRTRTYAIASDVDDATRWEIAVLREDEGEGGSVFIHDSYAVGRFLACKLPKTGFALHTDARPAILVAGGIGIAPLKSMAHELKRESRDFEIHFSARTRADAPYLTELRHEFSSELHTYWPGPGSTSTLDLDALVARQTANSVFYVCGPDRMIVAMQSIAEARGLPADAIRFERFAAPPAQDDDQGLQVKLA